MFLPWFRCLTKKILTFQIESLTLTFHGHDLIVDSSLELNYGRYYELQNQLLSLYAALYFIDIIGLQIHTCWFARRYGLLGLNGCGKSTLLDAIGCRELPIPEHMDIYHLAREIEATDMTSLQAVMNVDEERIKLEKEAEILSAKVVSILNYINSISVILLGKVFYSGI